VHINPQNMKVLIKLLSLMYLSKTHTIPGAFQFQHMGRLTKTSREKEEEKDRANEMKQRQ
jgi:hypothetical protein